MTATAAAPGRPELDQAAERLDGVAHRTPVLTSSSLDERTGARVFLKCENFQRVGAFKFRGAYNTVASLGDEERRRGLVTHSSGNHAQAVALAAKLFDVPATIVMPEGAPAVKRAAVKGYGARVVTCADTLESRQETAAAECERTGGVLVHPYDDPRIIAGQSTAARELLEEAGDLDLLLVPVGGGGLASGTCLLAHHLSPETRVVGCEPSGADDAARSLAAGRLLPMENPRTLADGLRSSLSQLTFGILQDHVAAILTVDDDSIVAAMRYVFERMKIVIEPSCAVPVAVLLSDRLAEAGLDPAGRRVGLILTGGNVDLDHLPWTS